MSVYVYRNVTRKCWSVRCNGKVIDHAHELLLYDVKFKVSEAGRQRVLREKKKNVHAGAEGVFATLTPATRSMMQFGEAVKYNPYITDSFMRAEGHQPVNEAVWAYFGPNGEVTTLGSSLNANSHRSRQGYAGKQLRVPRSKRRAAA